MRDYKITGSPEVVWLNYGDIERDETHAGCISSGDVTWSEDLVFDSDVKYVRADLVYELRQQLAAALATCKAKDDQLSRAREGWMTRNDDLILDAITRARALQPDDSALMAWLGGPVGWYNGKDGEYGYDTMTLFEDIEIGSNLYAPKGVK